MPTSSLTVRLDTSLELLLERAPATQTARVLATVVTTAGSTYRKPGARMLIMADGSYLGLLSGGCLEADLKLHAQQVLDSGVPRAIEYDMRGPDDILFGIGAGCEGAMRVLLEPAGPGSSAAAALAAAGRATLSLGGENGRAAHLRSGPVPALLVQDRVAMSVVELLCDVDLSHLGMCDVEHGGCGWFFIDNSKNKTRRWCTMEHGGAQAKARRLTERRRHQRYRDRRGASGPVLPLSDM